MEIEIRVNKKYLVNYEESLSNGDVPFLWQRVASICTTRPNPHKQDDGYPWSLDDSNNWKAGRLSDMDRLADQSKSKDEVGNVIVVYYRYGSDRSFMVDVKNALEWFLR